MHLNYQLPDVTCGACDTAVVHFIRARQCGNSDLVNDTQLYYFAGLKKVSPVVASDC
jgi:hypothetical protein